MRCLKYVLIFSQPTTSRLDNMICRWQLSPTEVIDLGEPRFYYWQCLKTLLYRHVNRWNWPNSKKQAVVWQMHWGKKRTFSKWEIKQYIKKKKKRQQKATNTSRKDKLIFWINTTNSKVNLKFYSASSADMWLQVLQKSCWNLWAVRQKQPFNFTHADPINCPGFQKKP